MVKRLVKYLPWGLVFLLAFALACSLVAYKNSLTFFNTRQCAPFMEVDALRWRFFGNG